MSGPQGEERKGRIQVLVGDLTRQDVDVMVNAANVDLLRGGGVCGAIFRAAGPALDDACQAVAPCPTGEARMTPGFASRARWIAHSVGPIWRGGGEGEAELLASAYRAALALAASVNARSIAFPAISTGIYGFPFATAAPIAVATVRAWIAEHGVPHVVMFVFLAADDAAVYQRLLEEGSRAPS
jgi:O-acetyl-ADP-ribose deacetylase (regulator of RNase III)